MVESTYHLTSPRKYIYWNIKHLLNKEMSTKNIYYKKRCPKKKNYKITLWASIFWKRCRYKKYLRFFRFLLKIIIVLSSRFWDLKTQPQTLNVYTKVDLKTQPQTLNIYTKVLVLLYIKKKTNWGLKPPQGLHFLHPCLCAIRIERGNDLRFRVVLFYFKTMNAIRHGQSVILNSMTNNEHD